MKKLIVANWKQLPDTMGEAEEILDFLSENIAGVSADIVICPPDKYIEKVAELLQRPPLSGMAELGLQDISLTEIENLKLKIGNSATYVIVGHSSRRKFEPEEIINQKLKASLTAGLTPVVCIGENTRDGDYQQFLKDQFDATFAGLSPEEIGKCLVAYEPVWAISTNPGAKPDSPDETRKALAVLQPLAPASRLLYGGSVTKNNAKDFLSMPEISGVLIGGASVRKEEFVEILKQV